MRNIVCVCVRKSGREREKVKHQIADLNSTYTKAWSYQHNFFFANWNEIVCDYCMYMFAVLGIVCNTCILHCMLSTITKVDLVVDYCYCYCFCRCSFLKCALNLFIFKLSDTIAFGQVVYITHSLTNSLKIKFSQQCPNFLMHSKSITCCRSD